MSHPLLKNYRYLTYYISGWILLAVLYFLVLNLKFEVNLVSSVADAFVSNLTLGLLCFSLWYTQLYSKPEKTGIINLVIFHITLITTMFVIWIPASIGIVKHIVPDNLYDTKISWHTAPWRIVFGKVMYIMFTLSYYLTKYYLNLQDKLKSESLLIEKVKDAELNLLKSQINPHFLFNSLNSVSSLTLTNPDKAHEMIIRLSDFLRYTVSAGDKKMPELNSEIENIERYLEIEKVRFGKKILYEFNIPEDCKSAVIPAMILQPLYENAVKHGVYESTEQITVTTNCHTENQILHITITNNFDKDSVRKKGTGTGLKNIRERLRLIYGSSDLLMIYPQENIFEVRLRIPQN